MAQTSGNSQHRRSIVKLTLLGTGTSQGIPVIGCTCPVCTSADPHDNRLRSAALLQHGDTNILIDAGPDLRQQMLRLGIRHLDAILITHEHNDHVIGLDDIRPFNFSSGQPMRVYAQPRVAAEIRRRFDYVFGPPIPGLPRMELIELKPYETLIINDISIQPIGIWHGLLPIVGFRFGDLCYLTDVKTVDEAERKKIRGVPFLITSALQEHTHPTHMNLTEALEFIDDISPQNAWLTHLSHTMGCAAEKKHKLPPYVSFAYDGLVINSEHYKEGAIQNVV
jgi:phosphoribosyl 1,2-cyclic phosphate phosphodiesterase